MLVCSDWISSLATVAQKLYRLGFVEHSPKIMMEKLDANILS